MKTAEKLPDNIDYLKHVIHAQQAEIQSQKNEIDLLQEKLNLSIQKRFAAISEKHSPDQLGLFDEAESLDQGDEIISDESGTDSQSTEVKSHPRKKPGRKPLPESTAPH